VDKSKGDKGKEGKEKDKSASQPAASAAAAAAPVEKEEKAEGTKKKSSGVRKSKKDETSASASAAASGVEPGSGAKYRLHYFNGRGRGELARLCFVYGGIHFDDVRYSADTFKQVKPDMPFGQVPVLEMVEEKWKLSESAAIHFYAARMAGLMPPYENAQEFALCHMLTEGTRDIGEPIAKIIFGPPEQKEEKMKEYKEKTLPMWVDRYESLLNKNGKFFVGNKLTVADFAAFETFSNLQGKFPDCLDKAPSLQVLFKSISEDPKVAKYLASRPKSEF